MKKRILGFTLIELLIVITINAILGTVQTVKAEQSLASLKKLSGPEAKVLRDGSVVPIPSAEVTVGDIVMLDAGDYIPADGRLLESASLKVDESALTGESLGVEKMTDAIEGEVPLGDRTNMVYSGSFVTYGRGSFVVTGIGMETEVGKIASLLKTTSEKKTPLQVNLDQFGQKLSIIILVFCGILFGIRNCQKNLEPGITLENLSKRDFLKFPTTSAKHSITFISTPFRGILCLRSL